MIKDVINSVFSVFVFLGALAFLYEVMREPASRKRQGASLRVILFVSLLLSFALFGRLRLRETFLRVFWQSPGNMRWDTHWWLTLKKKSRVLPKRISKDSSKGRQLRQTEEIEELTWQPFPYLVGGPTLTIGRDPKPEDTNPGRSKGK